MTRRRRLAALLAGAGFRADDRIELMFGEPMPTPARLAGLTETDAIVIGDRSGVEGDDPAGLPQLLASRLGERTSDADVAGIEPGRLAVTVSLRDGTTLRLLPALRTGEDIRMASHDGREWFGLGPAFFAGTLRSENDRHGDRLVPVIRLAKGAIAAVPEASRLNGYHVETLGIAVCRGYDRPPDVHGMLTHLVAGAGDAVLRPLVNASGESLHIDDDLGAADSAERRRIADALAAVGRHVADARTERDWERPLTTPEG